MQKLFITLMFFKRPERRRPPLLITQPGKMIHPAINRFPGLITVKTLMNQMVRGARIGYEYFLHKLYSVAFFEIRIKDLFGKLLKEVLS